MFAQSQYKSFVQTFEFRFAPWHERKFVQSLRRQGREALVATAVAKFSFWRSLFVETCFFFSLAPLVSREKDKDCLGRLLNTYILISLFICSTDIFDIPFPAFFFDTSGAKKKAHKKETPFWGRAQGSALRTRLKTF